MGVSWIRYFAVLLLFAGMGVIIMGLQYHTALVENASPSNETSTESLTGEQEQPTFIQSAWSLIAPNAKLSKNQAGIVSSGLITMAFGLLMLFLGPLLLLRLMDRFDL